MFSIVIPTYNNEDRIASTIESVLNQTYNDWELIIVDDGSTDSTKEKIIPYLNYQKIQYVHQPNAGVTGARNKGIEYCKSKFVTFLDADDTVTKNWLQDFYELSVESKKPGYLSGAILRNSKLVLPKVEVDISKKHYSSLAGSFAILTEIIRNIGGYDTHLKQSENWEMTARALHFCEKNNYDILFHENANLIYDNYPTNEETLLRDRYRAEAVLYLHDKYAEKGVFHYRKDEFLVSSAINFTRIKSNKIARRLFYKSFRNKPSIVALSRVIIFEIPFLRNRIWLRKDEND
ncbi:glycosyltransferase family A protein [uncultured Christiangramia sp.]|uniref:glycosyltransferase family A protein n=1 Tax=uncultured Christiangramia sp. TaxID=503836 RepID=UPI00260E112A|nr:glycosyltransferase family A protein [uncultured Christiangramia sp.]